MSEQTIINNTSTTFQTNVYSVDMVIEEFILTNKSVGTVTLNVQIFDGNNHVNISPKDVQLLPSTSYADEGIVLKSGNVFLFVVNGSCDYYIDIIEA